LTLEPVIGFEIHAQLTTRTKLFCGCANEFGGPPNSRTCPVCLGLPGALPVLNESAVDAALAVALALNARVAARSGFARKNYFYPDLPKGYQITQFGAPLARGGHLDVTVGGAVRRVGIRQVHLEEDAGKSVHAEESGRSVGLIDMNRCGVPLVEIVTEPDIHSVEEADTFLTALRRLLVYLGVVTGDMHEGGIRFDTNVSLRPAGEAALGTQTEIKNLNSFRSVRRALQFEIGRQSRILSSGGEVRHETLLWDERAGRAVAMRSKEAVSDYRYFPEPDLVDFTVGEERLERVAAGLPETPEAARARLVSLYGIPDYDASVLTADPATLLLYELTVEALLDRLGDDAPRRAAKTVSNWVMVVLAGYLNERGLTPADLARGGTGSGGPGSSTGDPPGLEAMAERLAEVVAARLRGDVSGPAARKLLAEALETEEPIEGIIEALGLRVLSDERELESVVDRVLSAHPEEVERYRGGAARLMRFFIGQVLKLTGGRADPEAAGRMLEQKLNEGGRL